MATRRDTTEQILPGHLRLRVTVGYDGTNYLGWQTQREGPTVQQQLELALGRIFASQPVTHSSSRTDAGVHGLGMVAHFDIPKEHWRMDARKLI
ncbi:MAG TPA: tRNA pseudouridine(38-40) synthase TruA, partial [Candidatus Limnocylindria bacterium]|nr:tRNA pseudouridine(38-40) synthase TruA [Candidatus Limnocylindria bacterium]